MIAHNLLQSIEYCSPTPRACFRRQAIAGFRVRQDRIDEAWRNPILVTALNPVMELRSRRRDSQARVQGNQPVLEGGRRK